MMMMMMISSFSHVQKYKLKYR